MARRGERSPQFARGARRRYRYGGWSPQQKKKTRRPEKDGREKNREKENIEPA